MGGDLELGYASQHTPRQTEALLASRSSDEEGTSRVVVHAAASQGGCCGGLASLIHRCCHPPPAGGLYTPAAEGPQSPRQSGGDAAPNGKEMVMVKGIVEDGAKHVRKFGERPIVQCICVLGALLFPVADLTADAYIALPGYIHAGLVESFEVQLVGMVGSSVFSYVSFLQDQLVWQKMGHVPSWMRAILLAGGVFVWPFAPLFVMAGAIVAVCSDDEDLLKECVAAVHVVVRGEFLEGLVSNAIQAKALLINDVDVRISIVLGLFSATKAALHFDLQEHAANHINMTGGHQGDQTVTYSVVRGVLPNLVASPIRTMLLALTRLSELSAGISCALVFHITAYHYEYFMVHVLSRSFSIAGPLFMAAQVLLSGLSASMLGHQIDVFSLLLTPFCVPKGIMDEHVSTKTDLIIKAAFQLLVALLVAGNAFLAPLRSVNKDLPGEKDHEKRRLLQVIAAGSCVGMWVTLWVVRALLATSEAEEEEGEEIEAKTTVQSNRPSGVKSAEGVQSKAEETEESDDIRGVANRLISCANENWRFLDINELRVFQQPAPHPRVVKIRERLRKDLMVPETVAKSQEPPTIRDKKDEPFDFSPTKEALCALILAVLPTSVASLKLTMQLNAEFKGACLSLLPRTLVSLDLELAQSSVSAAGLQQLPPDLRRVRMNLKNCDMGKASMPMLPPKITELVLELDQSPSYAMSLKELPPKLENLTLSLQGIKESEGLVVPKLPATITRLTLKLDRTQVAAEGLQQLPPNLGDLYLSLKDAKGPVDSTSGEAGSTETRNTFKFGKGFNQFPDSMTTIKLDLSSTGITDEALPKFPEGLTELTLVLWRSTLTNVALQGLPRNIKRLSLNLVGCLSGIDNKCLQNLPPSLVRLELHLGVGKITEAGLHELSKLDKLEEFVLVLSAGCKVGGAGLQRLPAGLKKIKLDLRPQKKAAKTDFAESIQALAERLPALASLEVKTAPEADAGLREAAHEAMQRIKARDLAGALQLQSSTHSVG
eukprot:TRINITY_DN49721_c0_g1_i1.p1 TRINITY_DN49721_c0_g1~~TRINITY_DN49721_c0_g1_i1.p1  ORF type:complete len:1000 (+),score=150.24 TRINITY_DN49721_c0_g1_i1:110-3109(+)